MLNGLAEQINFIALLLNANFDRLVLGRGMLKDTLDYYNENAKKYFKETVDVNFSETQNRFLKYLQRGDLILDFGCGSGRDSKYFLDQGYKVEAIDGSIDLCKLASEYTGIRVRHMHFQDLDKENIYNGVWACSSILHLKKSELVAVMEKIALSLKSEGVLYASFKYGDFQGEKNGRYFTYLDENSLEILLNEVKLFSIEEKWVSNDVRPDRITEKWLNIILRKI